MSTASTMSRGLATPRALLRARKAAPMRPVAMERKLARQERRRVVQASRNVRVHAASAGGSEAKEEEGGVPLDSPMAKTMLLGGLFGAWYLFNIFFNMCVRENQT
eukprot:scaffold840_cov344-Pavlova_lutheri.AAC.58